VGLAGEVSMERPDRGRGRRRPERPAGEPIEDRARGEEAAGRRLHVSLHAGDLPREEEVGALAHREVRREQARRLEERVPVDLAEPQELGAGEPRDELAEDAALLGPGETRLEPDQVEGGAGRVLPPELHHRVRAPPGARILEADRLHRPVREHLRTPFGHHLDRQAALEVARLLERVRRDLATRDEGRDEREVLPLVERQVQVVVPLPLPPS